MKKKLLLILSVFWFSKYCNSQLDTNSRIPCDPVNYCLCVHDMGKVRDPFILQLFIDDLNQVFSKTCISFSFSYLPNPDYNYNDLADENRANELIDMVDIYSRKNCINVYWVGTDIDPAFLGICSDTKYGKSLFLTGDSYDVVESARFIIKTLSFFGLRRPEFDLSNRELTNRSNGETSADSVWDTPADPFILVVPEMTSVMRNIILRNYFLSSKKDANGEYYNPMINNIMSGYVRNLLYFRYCNELTPYQYKRIVANEKKCRHKIWE